MLTTGYRSLQSFWPKANFLLHKNMNEAQNVTCYMVSAEDRFSMPLAYFFRNIVT